MKGLDGVLLLTAGFGQRAEPLSLVRPKALLPFQDGSLLGRMALEAGRMNPRLLAVNASRCPALVLEETRKCSRMDPLLLFEERPLGVVSTLSALAGTVRGPWMLMNTDMVLKADLEGLFRKHQAGGALCTLLCGDPPAMGSYGSVQVSGVPRHYLGVCVLEPEVFLRSEQQQGFQNLFSPLIVGEPAGYEGAEVWMDMGEAELFRLNLLGQGSFIHPEANVSTNAVLARSFHVSKGCVVEAGAVLSDSVMLEGSALTAGAGLEAEVLPWFSRRSCIAHRQ